MNTNIKLEKRAELEWSYEPISYVEKPFSIDGSDRVTRQNTEVLFNYSIYIGNGKAEISLESQDEYDEDMREIIRDVLECSFLPRFLETGESWKLGKLSVSELLSDGSRAFHMSTCGQCDQSKAIINDVIKEKDGIRYLDTRTETIKEREKRIIETIEEINKIKIEENPELYAKEFRSMKLHDKHKENPTLKIIMKTYLAACRTEDARDKIFLFFDIRDAINQFFRSEATAKEMLKESNPSENDIEHVWEELGRLANSTKFGRHSGKIAVDLARPLEGKEKAKKRVLELNSRTLSDVLNDLDEYAKKFIKWYLNYLEYREKNPQ
jgi:hypothetical protein